METSVEPKAMEGLIEGRIVHYVLPNGCKNAGYHRPAIITQVWNAWTGTSNLQVFVDGENDGHEYTNGLCRFTSVMYSENKEPGTWHWIERA